MRAAGVVLRPIATYERFRRSFLAIASSTETSWVAVIGNNCSREQGSRGWGQWSAITFASAGIATALQLNETAACETSDRTITAAELANHVSENDCWLAIDGSV